MIASSGSASSIFWWLRTCPGTEPSEAWKYGPLTVKPAQRDIQRFDRIGRAKCLPNVRDKLEDRRNGIPVLISAFHGIRVLRRPFPFTLSSCSRAASSSTALRLFSDLWQILSCLCLPYFSVFRTICTMQRCCSVSG